MTYKQHGKDGGWGWVVVLASFVINFIMDGVRYSFGLLYIEFLTHFDATKGAVGLIGGIMFGLLLIAAPISATLVNKFGCRSVTITGSCLVSLGFLCSSFATRIFHLYLSMGLLGGVGFSMLFMTMYVAIIQRFEKYRSLAIGLAVSGSGLGGFAFSPVANYLMENYTWRGTLMVLSAVLLNGCVCGALMRPMRSDAPPPIKDAIMIDQATERCEMLGELERDSGKSEHKQVRHEAYTDGQEVQEHVIDSLSEIADGDMDDITEHCKMIDVLERDDEKTEQKAIIKLGADIKEVCVGVSMDSRRVTELDTRVTKTDHTDVCDRLKGERKRDSINANTRGCETETKGGNSVNFDTEKSHGECLILKQISSFLLKIFRFSLLLNKLFLLFAIVEICINISYMVPFMYSPDMARDVFGPAVTRHHLVWIANAMSIANVASRVPIGVLADCKVIGSVKLMGILCVSAGLSCAVMPFCGSYGLLLTACICYSASIVSAMVLIPVVLSEFFGDDVIADSFGLSLFFGGVSGLFGTPLAGWLYDLTGTYELTFITAGVEFTLGGVLLFLMASKSP